MPDFRGGVLDLDGVVVDTEALHLEATMMVFDRHGLSMPGDDPGAWIGRTDRDIFNEVLEKAGRHDLDVDSLLSRKHDVYGEIVHRIQAIPGSRDFIRAVAASPLRLGLATSSERINQQRAFDALGLDGFFDAVVTATDVTRTKPDPEPYRLAVERLRLEPSDCFVVEDSFNGVRSARDAGCHAIGLSTSFSEERLLAAGALKVVHSFDELYDYVGVRKGDH